MNRVLKTYIFLSKISRIVKVTRLKLLRPYLDFPVIWRLFGYGDEEEKCINALMNYSKVLIDAKFKEREETGAVTGTATRPFLAYLMDGTDDREDIAYHINALMFAVSLKTRATIFKKICENCKISQNYCRETMRFSEIYPSIFLSQTHLHFKCFRNCK